MQSNGPLSSRRLLHSFALRWWSRTMFVLSATGEIWRRRWWRRRSRMPIGPSEWNGRATKGHPPRPLSNDNTLLVEICTRLECYGQYFGRKENGGRVIGIVMDGWWAIINKLFVSVGDECQIRECTMVLPIVVALRAAQHKTLRSP